MRMVAYLDRVGNSLHIDIIPVRGTFQASEMLGKSRSNLWWGGVGGSDTLITVASLGKE